MTETNRFAFDQCRFIRQNRMRFGTHSLLIGQPPGIGAGKADRVSLIRNLCAEPADHKQFFIAGVGLDKPALNTAFQYSGEHQALRCNDVSANKAVTLVWSMVFGALLFHEQIRLNQVIGCALAVIGVVLFVQPEKDEKEEQP